MTIGSITGRVAVIGDVGGHVAPLRAELRRLGADPRTGALPGDLIVVQVGDLIHRGPDSEAVVDLVDGYLTSQPDQWVQLVGNHEMLYLGEPDFHWPEQVADPAVATLRRWWKDGQMRVAAAFQTPDAAFLVTHAGLTAGLWRAALGTPISAAAAAVALNNLVGKRDAVVVRSGVMLTGRRANHSAGPLWADAARELLPSWLQTPMSFSQIHGHSSLQDWDAGRFRAGASIAARTRLDVQARHEWTILPGGSIIGVDPGLGATAVGPWRAWENVLVGRVVR